MLSQATQRSWLIAFAQHKWSVHWLNENAAFMRNIFLKSSCDGAINQCVCRLSATGSICKLRIYVGLFNISVYSNLIDMAYTLHTADMAWLIVDLLSPDWSPGSRWNDTMARTWISIARTWLLAVSRSMCAATHSSTRTSLDNLNQQCARC